MNRTQKSLKNITAAAIGQSFGLIISFVARIFFVQILGKEYLGLNGLFSNILTILSLAELGVGEAITFSLYKPLAKHDTDKCRALMQLYKKVYTIIGVVIFVLGLAVSPFLNYLIKDVPDIPNIQLIFILFVLNTSISYFFSYKRNLIIADQNRYIATIYRYGFFFVLNVAQIICLATTKNYILFLSLQIITTLLENIAISLKANQLYPYLKNKESESLDKRDKNEIIKNTKAMLMHKVGGIIVSSTDNLLLSKFVNLASVGLYSNYYLITNAINLVFNQVFSSITASVGNLCVGKDYEKQYKTYKKVDFLNYWITSFATICLICLFSPLITIWLGNEYTFNFLTTLIIVINFYVYGMRKTNLTFREASGLFYKDRWKAVIEAEINLVASIILAIHFGVFGVFLGTFISSITTCVWVEPYILYKYQFKKKLRSYFGTYIKRAALTTIIATAMYYLCSFVNSGDQYIDFSAKLIACLAIPNFVMWLIFRKANEFRYFKDLIAKIIKSAKRKIAKKSR